MYTHVHMSCTFMSMYVYYINTWTRMCNGEINNYSQHTDTSKGFMNFEYTYEPLPQFYAAGPAPPFFHDQTRPAAQPHPFPLSETAALKCYNIYL